MKEKTNVYQLVTERIINELEKGIIPWQCPWTGASLSDGGAINYVTRRPYSVINQLLLGKPGEYLSFKQVQNLGGKVKKGSHASMVVFYTTSVMKKKVTKEVDGKEETEVVEFLIPVLKYYNVFHIDDCEGIPSKLDVEPENEVEPIEEADNIINDYVKRETSLKFINDKISGRAFYSPASDTVVVPMISQYDIVEEYYSTSFHELTHSTMIESRCNRKSEQKGIAAFGNEEYSREELVAEIGSAMLCNYIGLDNEKAFKNSVAYVQGWLKKLKDDSKLILWAASRAEKAAKYILNLNTSEK